MTTQVASSATGSGIFSIKRTSVSAANNTIAPCAKLKTPDALNIRTRPSATSEYSTPDMRPPIKTSRKKPMRSVRAWRQQTLGSAAAGCDSDECDAACLRSPSMLHAQIRIDHRLIVAYFFRCAVAYLAAVVEHYNAV